MKVWHEDEDFWRTMEPFLFSQGRWEDAPAQVDGLLKLTETPPSSAVLDMCCGPGRHSLELARRGYRVTAVDRTAEYLESARSRAKSEGLQIDFIMEDMRRFQHPAGFQLALSLYTSFGYFEDPEDDMRVARNLCDALAAQGKLVVEIMGREVLSRIFRERDWQPIEGGGFFLEERNPSSDWTWMNSRWILIREGQIKEYNIAHRIYGGADLSRVLLESGFQKVELFGDLQGSPYNHTAKRLVVVASK
jgi:SAM-dependent methyltransferase